MIHTENKKTLNHQGLVLDAEDGNRTRTVVTHRRILSPVRLPVPPPRHVMMIEEWWALRDSNPRPIGYEPTALTN